MTINPRTSDYKVPLTWQSFLLYYVPFGLAYQTAAILVFTNKSHFVRLAFFPLALMSSYHLATSIQLSRDDPRLAFWDHANMIIIGVLTMRIFGWAITTDRRQKTDCEPHTTIINTLHRSIDLSTNARGIGWNWGKGTWIPAIPDSYMWKLFATVISQTILFDLVHAVVRLLLPSQSSGSIFDPLLPLVQRCVLAYIISVLVGVMTYLFIDTVSKCIAFIAIFLNDDPSSWPPIFDSPWLSTSLADFWGRRWHQVLRHIFLATGGRPLSFVFGSFGLVMGTFFASGVVHALGVWGMGRGGDFVRVCGFFLLMGIGLISERCWYIVTGYRVRGWLGWVWTFVWIFGWGSITIFDAWVCKGMVDSMILPPWLQVSAIIPSQ